MKTPQFLTSLWRKIEEKIKKQRDAKSQSANDTHVPSTDLPPYRHRAVHHHPNAHEVQHRTAEREYWQDQLRLAKDLNDITKTLNTITIVGTVLAGLAAGVGALGLIILWCTLVETIENDRLEQRAWVGVKNIQHPIEAREGIPWVFKADHVNSGKTPALNVKTITAMRTMFEKDPFVAEYSKEVASSPRRSVGMMPPGTEIHPATNVVVITKDQSDAFNQRVVRAYVYGEISYDDVFGLPHCTTYCFYFFSDFSDPIACETYGGQTDAKCENIP